MCSVCTCIPDESVDMSRQLQLAVCVRVVLQLNAGALRNRSTLIEFASGIVKRDPDEYPYSKTRTHDLNGPPCKLELTFRRGGATCTTLRKACRKHELGSICMPCFKFSWIYACTLSQKRARADAIQSTGWAQRVSCARLQSAAVSSHPEYSSGTLPALDTS